MSGSANAPRSRRPSPAGWSAAATLLLHAGVARAALSGDFADALDIDQTYVTGVSAATDIAFATDGRAVVTSKNGDVVIRHLDGSKVVISSAFPNLDTDSEKGLTGIVADPRLAAGFFFYVDNGPSTADKHRVYHGLLAANDALTVDLEHPVVGAGVNAQDEGLEGPANHDGGGLFVYGSHLYVSVGDTGQNAWPPVNKYASCLNKGNGKILRVNLDGTIPADNPLAAESSVTACDDPTGAWTSAPPDERVYAWGLRNPFRFWVDPHTGRMWIGDVGEISREEISVSAPAASYTGEHFGYPFHEGLWNWDLNGSSLADHDCDTQMTPARACTDPVTDYDHTVGSCVIGGLIPEGCGWRDALGGAIYYWFADFVAGWVRALEVTADRSGVTSATPVEVGTFASSGPSAIRQGPNGAVYLVNNSEGSVYEIQPKFRSGADCISMGGAPAGGGGGQSGSSAGGSAQAGGRGGTTAVAQGGKTAQAGAATDSGATDAVSGAPDAGAPNSGGQSGASDAGSAATAGAAGDDDRSSPGAGGVVASASGGAANESGAAESTQPSRHGANDAKSDSGCGCRTATASRGATANLAGLLGLLALALRRRSGRVVRPRVRPES